MVECMKQQQQVALMRRVERARVQKDVVAAPLAEVAGELIVKRMGNAVYSREWSHYPDVFVFGDTMGNSWKVVRRRSLNLIGYQASKYSFTGHLYILVTTTTTMNGLQGTLIRTM